MCKKTLRIIARRNHCTVTLISCLFLHACAGSQRSPLAKGDQQEIKESSTRPRSQLAHEALKKGKYPEALVFLERDFAESIRHPSQKKSDKKRIDLARIYLLMGRFAQLEKLLAGQESPEFLILRARNFRSVGKLDEALKLLSDDRSPQGGLSSLHYPLLKGEILLEKGERKKAEIYLQFIIRKANDEEFSSWSSQEKSNAWSLVARSAHLLRSPEDANDAFNQAEEVGDPSLQLLLWRAELFLEKFDLAHAGEVLTEAIKKDPHHPDVLIAQARFQLTEAFAFDEAEKLALKVLQINPSNRKAHFILAGVQLRDLNITQAMKHIDAGLRVNGRDLPLLSMKATARFLAEDPVGFEELLNKISLLSPGYTEVYRIVGEYAEWEHRYPDMERLMRRAVRIDRKDGRIRALLGLTMVRSASDAAGVVELRKSFELDPFNLRVLNTLDLYEKVIPRDYVSISQGRFRFRFPQDEVKLLERYVPQLLEKAYKEMQERYRFTPQDPIGIELYSDREQFAVRTSGLPRTAIQGVCFGRKLATISPLGSPGNLGMTLWHELGHVFHIGLSNNRVPRWLTEGMAEWETENRDIGWSREMDLQLYRAHQSQRLPQLGFMSRAFTRARRHEDVSIAYYASGQIVKWIIESRGEQKAVSLLRELGNKRLPQDVVPEVLQASFDELDREFATWLTRELQRFVPQFISRDERNTLASLRLLLQSELAKGATGNSMRLSIGLAHLREGELKEASRILTSLSQVESGYGSSGPAGKNHTIGAQAQFFLARIHLASDRKVEAQKIIEGMLQKGLDGFELRMMLVRIQFALGKPNDARVHLKRATELDSTSAEPWSLLAALGRKAQDQRQELEAVKNWAALSENDATVHRRLLLLLLENELYEEAARAAELAIWVDLSGVDTHRLAGIAFARVGNLSKAEYEWESALLCPASTLQKNELQKTWTEELKRLGFTKRALQVSERFNAIN